MQNYIFDIMETEPPVPGSNLDISTVRKIMHDSYADALNEANLKGMQLAYKDILEDINDMDQLQREELSRRLKENYHP